MTDRTLDFREDRDQWPVDSQGYAICPRCGSMVRRRYREIHADVCGRGEEPDHD